MKPVPMREERAKKGGTVWKAKILSLSTSVNSKEVLSWYFEVVRKSRRDSFVPTSRECVEDSYCSEAFFPQFHHRIGFEFTGNANRGVAFAALWDW